MINHEILLARGGVISRFKKNQPIFLEGNLPLHYYQLIEGSVRMVNTNEVGKEFIQEMFLKDQSFGEPLLITEVPYAASALANEDSIIIRVSKEDFLKILDEFPGILLEFVQVFANRIHNKSIIAKEIAIYNSEHKIFTILNLYKKKNAGNNLKKFKVDISRQQIADMIGLRVETVIRTVSSLQRKDKLKIEKGKIYM
jgi:CRP-like cAMP-binding protein